MSIPSSGIKISFATLEERLFEGGGGYYSSIYGIEI